MCKIAQYSQECHFHGGHGGTGPHNILEFTKQEGSILLFQKFSIIGGPHNVWAEMARLEM